MSMPIFPTRESVFTEEYWQAATPFPAQAEKAQMLGRLTHQGGREVMQLCAEAATAIFKDDPREVLATDASLGYTPDTYYTQPGSVLLVDIEMLTPGKVEGDQQQKIDSSGLPPEHMIGLQEIEDLAASPAYLFRKNGRRPNPAIGWPVPVVYPYRKILGNSESQMRYIKQIGLGVFAYDESGNVGGGIFPHWKSEDKSLVRGGIPLILLGTGGYNLTIPPVEIGSSYTFGAEGECQRLVRVRSAELCLQGALSAVRAKRKRLHKLLTGRLATAGA